MASRTVVHQPEATSQEPSATSAKALQTRTRLIAAGIALFSSGGYDATGTRQIETHAGVKRNLISYHFGSKETFWKACMTQLFQGFERQLQPAIEQSRDIAPVERIRFLIRRFVRVNAAHPEMNRIMFDVGRNDSWRLQWIVDHYGRSFYERVGEVFAEGVRHDIIAGLSPVQFYYLLVGSTAIFSMAPECRLLSGEDFHGDDMVDAHANAVAALLTQGAGAS